MSDDVGRVVVAGVGDAEAAAEVELAQLDAENVTNGPRAGQRLDAPETSKPAVSKICEPM